MADTTRMTKDAAISVVPANEASWEDLQAVLGTRGDPFRCQCQRYKMRPGEAWASFPVEERARRLRTQTDCGHPESTRPADSSVPRRRARRLVRARAALRLPAPAAQLPRALEGRSEDKTDDSVWAATCFVTRAGFRRRGVSRALAPAAVDFARERGARALEGYPMLTEPGKEITWGELHVGSRSIFAAAGFAEVSRPSRRRVVMRIEF